MKYLVSSIIATAVIFLSGCGGDVKPAAGELSGKLVITGSSTIEPLASELGKKFEKMHPGVRVDVQPGGTARGIKDARDGSADIGMASRALKDDERDLKSFLIARDGICMILNKANPVKELSDEQVVAIYTGKIVNWKDVGGNDAPITVVNKAVGRSTLELFEHYFKVQNKDIQAHVVVGESQQATKTVAGNPNAIGYVSIGTAEFEEKQGAALKLLASHGVIASVENVKNKTFPMSRELNLVTKTEPQGLVKAYLNFVTSADANTIIKEQFFVPIKE